jgi:hypothetical protein
MIEAEQVLLFAANEDYAAACDRRFPSNIYRPKLFIDGDKWCALYGENIQDGVCGFGDTPELAMQDFDRAWCEHLPKPPESSE